MVAPSTFAKAIPTATRAFYKIFSEDAYDEDDDAPAVSRIFL